MSNSMMAGDFAAAAMALYAGHLVGDYWVQTDSQAREKGQAGEAGRLACLAHVSTYLFTQYLLFVVMGAVFDWSGRYLLTIWPALLVSGVTHYMADRREHGLMFKLARKIPGKANFLELGTPRPPRTLEMWGPCSSCEGRGAGGAAADESTNGQCWDCRAGGTLPSHVVLTDNPSLGTGAWALDQSWHIFWGVFVPALLVVAL